MVYFMQLGPNGPIKVGFSRDPDDRRRRLQRQIGDAERLSLVACIPGGDNVERVVHERFARARLAGEWFSPDDDELDDFMFGCSVMECLWPEDRESPCLMPVLEVLREAGEPLPTERFWSWDIEVGE